MPASIAVAITIGTIAKAGKGTLAPPEIVVGDLRANMNGTSADRHSAGIHLAEGAMLHPSN